MSAKYANLTHTHGAKTCVIAPHLQCKFLMRNGVEDARNWLWPGEH
jgi:hypothetical protein